jgi:outer membrane protein, heavy metal efflux system
MKSTLRRVLPLLLAAAGFARGATPLAALLDEAEHNNPQVLAARRAWQAATLVASQVSTLPDPHLVVQEFNVGSPRPFAGFTNNDFAYLGVGVSQDLPYPGKLRLRGEVADREAAAQREQLEAVHRSVRERVKAAYFQLAYHQRVLAILGRDGKLLEQIEKIAEARYRVGRGNQQEVLKAQLEQTKLVRERTVHHEDMDKVETQFKQVLGRPPDSPDLSAEELTETPLPYTAEELLAWARTQNPDVSAERELVRRQGLQVELARKDFYPDFNVQYMWQHTAEQFRDYHMLTFGMTIPLYRRRKLRPELDQAVDELNRSRHQYEASVQQSYFDVKDQFVAAEASAQLLKIYREGLIPQAIATFQAGLVAYESNRQDFETLLGSFLDVLQFDEEYWRSLTDHEVALAHLERVTGITLP